MRRRDLRNQSGRDRCRLSDQPDVRRPTAGLNGRARHHRAPFVEARIGYPLALRKTLKDLNPNFLSERAFDPAHAIPEPNDFPLFLDIHWPPPKQWPNRT
jgi:hypothetical protein